MSYYNDFVKTNKIYLKASGKHCLILKEIYSTLGEINSDTEAELIQEKIYEIGTNAGYDNLRDYFKELYQILLGQSEGPRLGSFIKLFGIDKTRELILSKIETQ